MNIEKVNQNTQLEILDILSDDKIEAKETICCLVANMSLSMEINLEEFIKLIKEYHKVYVNDEQLKIN